MNHESHAAAHAGQPCRSATAWVVALMLALVVGANDSQAATLIWTNGSDYWQSTTAWAPAGSFPGSGDNAIFTNAGTYYVTLTSDVLNIQSNFFSNASNTTATITLDLNTYELNPASATKNPGAFNVGDQAASTTIVYLASSTVAGKGLIVPSRIVVGRYGIGVLIITNGNVSVANTILGNAEGSGGTLVLSGASTLYTNTSQCAIGNNSNVAPCSLVISNSAVMDVVSTFRLGSGASQGGSSNCTMLLDTGARLFTHTGPVTIGNNGTLVALSPSYNNTATVQGGAVWDNGNASFVIGFAAGGGGATGNVLTVGAGGVVTNISQLTISVQNTLNMAGGLLKATTTCGGTVQGFGTVLGSGTISSGGSLKPFNSLGQLTFANSLTLASAATTTVQLGTNSSATAVTGKLTLDGTLNVTDGGGFTNGTYTLFTYGTLTDNGMTIGTTPNDSFNYAIDTSAAGLVKLHVTKTESGGLTVSNSVLQVGNVAVVVAGDTNVFSFDAADLGGDPVSYQWSFGDGVTNEWSSSNTVDHTYTTNCGPYDVSVIASNNDTVISNDFTIVVACQLNITKLQAKLSFSKPNADGCTVAGTFDLPADYVFAGKTVTLDIGGAEVTFALDSKGGGVSGFNKFSKPKYSKTTGLWTLKATLKKGSWQTPWADYGMVNLTIAKPGVLVTNLPVILLLDTEAFMGTKSPYYTATLNKSGTAK